MLWAFAEIRKLIADIARPRRVPSQVTPLGKLGVQTTEFPDIDMFDAAGGLSRFGVPVVAVDHEQFMSIDAGSHLLL